MTRSRDDKGIQIMLLESLDIGKRIHFLNTYSFGCRDVAPPLVFILNDRE